MKKVLLISNFVYHYRAKIYNYLYEEFKKSGYEFIVLTNDAQNGDFQINFSLIKKKPFLFNYRSSINEIKPDVIITFLHLKDLRIFPITYYARIKSIPIIYWNHGINLKTPDAKVKNILFHHLHSMSNAILLYSSGEMKYIKKKNHFKTFIANNTLNFEGIERNSSLEDKKYIRSKYGIKEEEYVLFVGRITPNKKLDVLLNILRNKEIAVVIVGPGLSSEQASLVDSVPNYYYLGEAYGDEVNKLFNGSKVFCMPGNIGLALNQAFFWGKPIITLEGLNSPEIIYVKNGENGYILKSEKEMEEKILLLNSDEELYMKLSKNASEIMKETAHIKTMFKGFLAAVEYVSKP